MNPTANPEPRRLRLVPEPATAAALAPYGALLGSDPAIPAVPTRYYGGTVTVRKPPPFASESPPEFSVCRLQPRVPVVEFLERHPRHTQAFLPLGGRPYVVVVAAPTPDGEPPPPERWRAFRFDGRLGLQLHRDTWHEFPYPLVADTDVVVVLSRDANATLRQAADADLPAGEARGPDLDKRAVAARFGVHVEIALDAASPADVVRAYWAAMRTNDWAAAAASYADDFVLHWPQSGERLVGRERVATMNTRYPAAAPWTFELESLLVDGDEVVTRTRVSDGTRTDLAITFSTVRDGRIVRQVEYWPEPFAPAPWRADLVERG